MKKAKKKLKLHRETLFNLEQVVFGGDHYTTVTDLSHTYCNEQFCPSGQATHCQDTQEFSWCVCTE